MSTQDKTEFIMAIRKYTCTKTERRSERIDVTASNASNEKILLRSIEPQGAGFVGVDEVKKMIRVMKNEKYNTGILIGRRFTTAAVQEMRLGKIQQVSDEYMPPFDTENLFLAIANCVDEQCKAKCGKIPLKKSDCTGYLHGNPCRVRALSDNSIFHFKRDWINLMKNDLKQLLSLSRSIQ
jgi:hypothetical protein